MLAVLVSLRVRPDRQDQFLAAIRANAASSLELERGCHVFDILHDQSDSHRFVLYEVYDSAEAFESHRQTPHFHRWRQAASECLDPENGQHNDFFDTIEVHEGGRRWGSDGERCGQLRGARCAR